MLNLSSCSSGVCLQHDVWSLLGSSVSLTEVSAKRIHSVLDFLLLTTELGHLFNYNSDSSGLFCPASGNEILAS